MLVPEKPWTMMLRALESIPRASHYLKGWEERAGEIPDPELRRQALMAINKKAFHCDGGSLYGLLAGRRMDDGIRFMVAYQSISDYLDNLCDRGTSLDPADFEALHESMHHALTPGAKLANYYRFRAEQDDGGYLHDLVRTCQQVLTTLPGYEAIMPLTLELSRFYGELQVHKHVRKDERLERLKGWFASNREHFPGMEWQEFAASTGSTLGIYALVSSALSGSLSPASALLIKKAYFPWMQGLHILLDYLVDQEEDRAGGDLSFCSYYDSSGEAVRRILFFFRRSDEGARALPHANFHRMICRGLPAVYLADPKVSSQKDVSSLAFRIIRGCGPLTLFFYLNLWAYRRIKG